MMSLVAYDTSSDSEESDNEESTSNTEPLINKQNIKRISTLNQNGITKQVDAIKTVKNPLEEIDNDERHFNTTLFKTLPTPKSNDTTNIEEADDEFLHKKEIPIITEKRPKGPVQITIPSLSEFKDVDDERGSKTKPMLPAKPKSCGLLGILPKPKQEVFIKTESSSKPCELKETVNKTKFIPDSVKNKPQRIPKLPNKKKTENLLESTADDSDGSDEDFFSLNTADDKLPEVSLNEINAMVAQRAAKMAEASARAEESLNSSAVEQVDDSSPSMLESDTNHEQQVNVDEKALHILVGSRAKRRKMEEVNIVELSSAEVLPNKDEWLRSTLSTSTQYQPTGVLVNEEPAPGTRRKHQITYLAHQAKANELELQAMWAANRHTRRQTQSKYGF